jgi:hypothetical protein
MFFDTLPPESLEGLIVRSAEVLGQRGVVFGQHLHATWAQHVKPVQVIFCGAST